MKEVFGIDISVHQKGMSIKQAKDEGANFVIIRAMYGNAKDVMFEQHYKDVKANGLGCGAYIWGRARNKAQAIEEAQILIEHCLKGKQFDYPIYYDVEDSIMINLSVDALTEVIEAWCETMEKAGYFCGVYMSDYAMKTETRKAELMQRYSLWIANWTYKKYKPKCQMWQFGGETNKVRTNKVAGYTCDQDFAYENFPDIITKAGLNGYSKNGKHKGQKEQTETSAQYVTVKKNDTLTKIASRNNISLRTIIALNPQIKNPDLIYAGQQVRVR